MSAGDLSALLTLLSIPVGGLIAVAILWVVIRRAIEREVRRQFGVKEGEE